MSEEKAMAIAENADIVLNGYAVTRDSENFRVVNLRTGKAAYIMETGWLIDGHNHDSGTRCCGLSGFR